MSAPNKRGRPREYDPDFHPDDFVERSTKGKCLSQIAREWGVCRDTIYDWANKYPDFSYAFKRGKDCLEAWYVDLGIEAIQMGEKIHFGVYVWQTKNLCGWRDKPKDEDSDDDDEQSLEQLIAASNALNEKMKTKVQNKK